MSGKDNKIVGHTQSGKSIYSDFDNPAHKKFTKQDHDDASDLFFKKLNNRYKTITRNLYAGQKTGNEVDNDEIYKMLEINHSKHFYKGTHVGEKGWYQPDKYAEGGLLNKLNKKYSFKDLF